MNDQEEVLKASSKHGLTLNRVTTSDQLKPTTTSSTALSSLTYEFYQTLIVKDLKEYGDKKPEEEYLKPETFGLSNDDCRHKKLIDMLDEHCFKQLSALRMIKDSPSSTGSAITY